MGSIFNSQGNGLPTLIAPTITPSPDRNNDAPPAMATVVNGEPTPYADQVAESSPWQDLLVTV